MSDPSAAMPERRAGSQSRSPSLRRTHEHAARKRTGRAKSLTFTTLLLLSGLAGVHPGVGHSTAQAADRHSTVESCIACHHDEAAGLAAAHDFGETPCTPCHAGDPQSADRDQAHSGLIQSPGSFATLTTSCAACHPRRAADVPGSFMSNLRGMVATTRAVFNEHPYPAKVDELGQGPADSLLRKRCVSCHLGQPSSPRDHPDIAKRGGGCNACHLKPADGDAHPSLSARVGDDRCLGCHSRSARISLNYAGLAEVDGGALRGPKFNRTERLARLGLLGDGRLIEQRPDDLHHRAGMSCIDCHTSTGLMGSSDDLDHHEDAVDIACRDCHANDRPRLTTEQWPAPMLGYARRAPFEAAPDQPFLTTASGTPLWHVQVDGERLLLHPKLGGEPLEIPRWSAAAHPLAAEHERLSCAACHSTWAPQCYGCHMEYDPDRPQWDHLERRLTPGRWVERRWDVRNGLPALGVRADGRIAPFVPGMVMTVEHPDWQQPLFKRLFATTSPHTVGPARGCESCHRSAQALGLGRGTLTRNGDAWRFEPAEAALADGVPADAWTTLDAATPGAGSRDGERSFNAAELRRILDAEWAPDRRKP